MDPAPKSKRYCRIAGRLIVPLMFARCLFTQAMQPAPSCAAQAQREHAMVQCAVPFASCGNDGTPSITPLLVMAFLAVGIARGARLVTRRTPESD